ncbi:amidase domain-containing protein [Kitasatospora sp. LaBMicrA B282]|uniref:amidase domain-containing protein n=1 Tax=Kitasatospora sp. LaBMicrA B282 TaxID=3420949 RepID=UPI003D107770
MKRSIWRSAAGAVITAALATTAVPAAWATSLTAATPTAATTARTPDLGTVADFDRLAQTVLVQRTAALLDQPPAQRAIFQTADTTAATNGRVAMASTAAHNEQAVDASLQARRVRLRAAGEAYQAGNTKATVDHVQLSGDGKRADVLLTETTTLTYEKLRGDEPPTTGFQAQHEATFVKDAQGHWQLTGLTDLDTDGFPQINEPTPSRLDSAVASTALASAATRPPLVAVTATTDPPEATPASTAWPAAPSPKPAKSGAVDYTAMAAYAEKYWHNYNPAYRQFNGAGGDCTNFISQSLRAGGWQFAGGWASDYDHTWWYSATNPATQSWSWNGVNEWSWYALSSKRVTNLADVYQLGVGDILQMDFDRTGSKDHSMIVTYRSPAGMPYVTYHSTNTLNRSVASLVAIFPDSLYYAYRT